MLTFFYPQVDMVGVLLRVDENHICMCKKCGELYAWRNGHLALGQCLACVLQSQASASQKRTCAVCPSTQVQGAPLIYPDPVRRRFTLTNFCAPHMPTQGEIKYVFTHQQLQVGAPSKNYICIHGLTYHYVRQERIRARKSAVTSRRGRP